MLRRDRARPLARAGHQMTGGVLLYSPGAVCPGGRLEGGGEARARLGGAVDRAVLRFRTQLGAEAMRPSIGVLEVGSGGIRPTTIALDAARSWSCLLYTSPSP